jgi:N6-L-threonylcarbamoyladenine synthase
VLVVAGGVAANRAVRETLQRLCDSAGVNLIAPPLELCGDNAAMIAYAGLERLEAGFSDDFSVAARPRWPLDEQAPVAIGSGKRGAKA